MVGGIRGVDRPEVVWAFRGHLASALKAGHGLGVRFDLRVEGGTHPNVRLGCAGPDAARWVTRILAPCYDRTAWKRLTLPTVDEPAMRREYGRRLHGWPERLREASTPTSTADDLTVALAGVPRGVAVRWRFSPCPSTWGRWPDLGTFPGSLRPDGTTVHGSHPGRGERPLDRWTPPGRPLFWRTTVTLDYPRSFAENPDLVRQGRSAVEAALRSPGGNGIRFAARRWPLARGGPWFALADDELLLVLPGPELRIARAGRHGDPTTPILPLGRTTAGRVVGPPIESDQGRHLAVLGETGMGKSSTLVAVARKASALGGVVLFDPLGETARSFRSTLARVEQSRLLWISPQADRVGINALEGIGCRDADPVRADRRLNDLVHALRRVRSGRYASDYWGPRLEEMLTRAVSAAAELPQGTLTDAHTLLATGGRTRQVVSPEARDAVRELSDRVRDRPDDAEGARRLLYEVVRSPVLRQMLCDRAPQRHASELVAPGRISVISGEASLVGETVARYLLSVYLALVWSELLARSSDPKTFVVLDESQWFSHDSLAEMLRLARRHNVHVVLATQTVDSLPETVAEAVWTNVSDFVAFRGSPAEARELSRATSAVSVEELLALPRGHAVVLLGKGNSVEWVRTSGRRSGPGRGSMAEGSTKLPRVGAPEGPDPNETRAPATVELVLGWIRERARADTAGATVRVDLAELRSRVDPAGTATREAGARLGRWGALLRSTKEGDGTVWEIDPSRIPAVAQEPPAPVLEPEVR